MSRERQKAKQDEVKRTILNVARDIIAKDGIDGLSIRKITNKIDYSPGIIYHYFKDKDEIIEILLNEGYARIVKKVSSVDIKETRPDKALEKILNVYIHSALSFPEEYKAFLLNNNPKILEKTALLFEGVSNESSTMKMLCENIKQGIEKGIYEKCDEELTAQIVWASTFGLVMKIILEGNITEQQKQRLMKQHLKQTITGILKIN